MIIKMTAENRRNLGGILRGQRVAAELERKANNILGAAGPGHEVDVTIGRVRARAAVITVTVDAMLSEATDRTLTRAIDAGRA